MKGFVLAAAVWSIAMVTFGGGMVQYRDFLSHDGKAIRGRVLRYDARSRKVTIERDNRKVFTVPIYAFSDEDQTYILEWEFNKVFLSDSSFRIEAKRKKMDTKKEGSDYDYYGDSIDSKKVETFGYELLLQNRSSSTLKGLEVEYCIYYEQETSGRGKTADEEGVRHGTLDVGSLGPKAKRTLTTEPVSIYTYELDADWSYVDGRDNKITGKVRGLWVKVHMKNEEGKVITRDFCMPDSLSNSMAWAATSAHVGRNK